MISSDSSSKLPLWVFVLTYIVLLGAAVWIKTASAQPLSTGAVVSIVACVLGAAVVLVVPIIARYERQKNDALDERQRALEALASTVSASAEQLSIAANGLHGITDLVHKNLRHAEQLPHKLQDKIAEFQSQLASVNDAEKEELEKELVALRSSESERLETASTKIAKTAVELAKLEAATQQHLTAANEAIAKLSMGTAAAIGKAQVAAEQALAQARTEAARQLGETAGNAARAVESAKASALSEIDAKLAAVIPAFVDQVARALSTKLAASSATPVASTSESVGPPHQPLPSDHAPTDPAAPSSPKSEVTAQPPKRPRKTRREEGDEAPAATPAPSSAAAVVSAAPEIAKDEPVPIPAEKIPEITPVAPHTAQPFATAPGTALAHAAAPANPAAPSPDAAEPPPPGAHAAPEPQKIARRRSGKKAEAETTDEPALDLGIQDAPPTNGAVEKTLTSDGATRLLVTAYIGIGNRLFIRGSGPGLSWEKGVPLQFVSIGKWRWETNDAAGPVQFKLFKNDDLECTSLGAQTVEPGYQQEVTATF